MSPGQQGLLFMICLWGLMIGMIIGAIWSDRLFNHSACDRGTGLLRCAAKIPQTTGAFMIVNHLSALISPDDVLYHKGEVTGRFGEAHWQEVISRAADVSIYTPHECEVMWDDLLAYYKARASMANPNEDLVACLGPDFMQHIWLLYTAETHEFFNDIAGTFLHHDPASESALINTPEAISKTTGLFRQFRIAYHPLLWRDHVNFMHGARVIKTGLVAVPAEFPVGVPTFGSPVRL